MQYGMKKCQTRAYFYFAQLGHTGTEQGQRSVALIQLGRTLAQRRQSGKRLDISYSMYLKKREKQWQNAFHMVIYPQRFSESKTINIDLCRTDPQMGCHVFTRTPVRIGTCFDISMSPYSNKGHRSIIVPRKSILSTYFTKSELNYIPLFLQNKNQYSSPSPSLTCSSMYIPFASSDTFSQNKALDLNFSQCRNNSLSFIHHSIVLFLALACLRWTKEQTYLQDVGK